MKKHPLSIVWFKKDLRIHDHEPLHLASKEPYLACIYIYEDELISQDHFTYRQLHFLNENFGFLAQKFIISKSSQVKWNPNLDLIAEI